MSRHIANVTWEEKLRLQLDEAQQLITRLTEALAEIAELDGDDDNQRFKLTRFQAAQVARRAYHAAVAKERAVSQTPPIARFAASFES